jgi:hypothetical protein
MAIVFITAYNDAVSGDQIFQRRVTIAMLKAAAAVQAETIVGLSLPAGYVGTTQTLHDLRAKLAQACLLDPDRFGRFFVLAVASDPGSATVGPASPDSDLQFTVNSLWNAFAVGGHAF